MKSLFRCLQKIAIQQLQTPAEEDTLHSCKMKVLIMEKINNIEVIAQNNFEKAALVVKKSGVRQAWESISDGQSGRLYGDGIIDEASGYRFPYLY